MEIRRVGENDKIGEFINVAFSEYAADCGVALSKLGIKGPLIRCPHSMSGVETMLWEIEYPDEVEAIVGLDIAYPNEYMECEGGPNDKEAVEKWWGYAGDYTSDMPNAKLVELDCGHYVHKGFCVEIWGGEDK